MGSCLGHKQVSAPSEIVGSHLGSHMVQIWDPRWDWRDPTREKHRLLGGIGRILHGTKLGSRVGLEARFHAGFCLECSWDPGWDWRDPTWDSMRDPMWEVPKSRSGPQVGLAGSHPGSQAGLAGSRLTFLPGY